MTKGEKMKKLTLQKLRKKAWDVFAKWIRRRDKGICFTCGGPGNQAGHYVHKDTLDFDERNINCQCVGCNFFRNGNLIKYSIKLQAKYGHEILKELLIKGNQVWKPGRKELEDIIEKYKEKNGIL